jgi:hypothetical protein
LTVIGQKGTNSLSNITVPKTAIPYGVTPLIYVNNQVAPNQGFWQNAKNYYIWYKTIFNNYELLIVFAAKASPIGFPIAAILSIVIIVPLSVATVLLQRRKESREKVWGSKTLFYYEKGAVKNEDYNSLGYE